MEISINKVLATNLKYWMEQAEMTQSALAEKAGVNQKTISNYLNPEQRSEGSKGKEPSAKLTELNKVATALGVEVWQLLRKETESERKLYAAIEAHYKTLREEVVTAAEADAENRRALESARIVRKEQSKGSTARRRS